MTTALDVVLLKTPNICVGRIRLDGTRITVHRIATLYKQGLNAEEIAQTYLHLSLGQVYVALAYYHSHRHEIEAELSADKTLYENLKHEPVTQNCKS